MSHEHNIVDADKVFTIDPFSRTIANESGAKNKIMQFDHKSERFTFRMPKVIEGHDMLNTDEVEIHFNNISEGTSRSARITNRGIYVVKDMQVDPEDSDRLVFTWLVEEESTQIAGILTFLVKFICYGEEDQPDSGYKWHTYPCSYITIMAGMDNSGEIIRVNSNIILELERRVARIQEEYIPNDITSIEVTESGELVFTFEDESTINAGVIVGQNGAPGKSAYEYACEGGYEGEESEFATKLAELLTLTSAEEVSF